ncbi:hypothetical protein D3C81_1970910 [compost metagenome]
MAHHRGRAAGHAGGLLEGGEQARLFRAEVAVKRCLQLGERRGGLCPVGFAQRAFQACQRGVATAVLLHQGVDAIRHGGNSPDRY